MVSRFTSIKINGLFGDRNEEINFPDLDDPIRILYGVNGSGNNNLENNSKYLQMESVETDSTSI